MVVPDSSTRAAKLLQLRLKAVQPSEASAKWAVHVHVFEARQVTFERALDLYVFCDENLLVYSQPDSRFASGVSCFNEPAMQCASILILIMHSHIISRPSHSQSSPSRPDNSDSTPKSPYPAPPPAPLSRSHCPSSLYLQSSAAASPQPSHNSAPRS